MAALDFPSPATNGQTYSSGATVWTYNSTKAAWIITSAGAQGPTGAQGSQGVQGVQGGAASLTSANTVMVSANGAGTLGSQYLNFVNSSTVTVSLAAGSGAAAGNANISFSIVGSAQGATGSQGVQGANGAQGAIGTQGSQGATGAQGSQGAAGAQGSQGVQGVQGGSASLTSANTVMVSQNGASTLGSQYLNFVNSSTVTISVVAGTGAAAGNANVSFTAVGGGTQGATGSQGVQGTSGSGGGGGGTVSASNTQVLFANATSAAVGSNNLTWNVASSLLSIDGNVRIANSGSMIFGGSQANTTANSHFSITYNPATSSLDFTFLG